MSKSTEPLARLRAVTADLSIEERRTFDSYLIGVLSSTTPAEKWDTALATARGCLDQMRAGRAS